MVLGSQARLQVQGGNKNWTIKRWQSQYLHGAKSRLESARNAFNRKDFPYVVRQSQEYVELSLKSALRFVGIEPPKWHDVGFILEKEVDRFPQWFNNKIERFMFISRKLRREREASMYGDEELSLRNYIMSTMQKYL